MSKYAKKALISSAVSALLSTQCMVAMADTSSSGSVRGGTAQVQIIIAQPEQPAPQPAPQIVAEQPPAGQGVSGGQNAPDNGQQAAPEEAEAGAIARGLNCFIQPALEMAGKDVTPDYGCTEKPAASDTGNAISRQQQIAARVRDGLDSLDISKPVLHNDFGLHAYTDLNINYYVTQAGVQTKETTILDEKVTIQVIPVSYQYTYGNGAVRTTSSAGAPGTRWDESEKNYTKTSTSYQFEKAGNFHSYVTVVYQARYRIGDNGPWMVAGTTEMRSEAMLLRVWEIDVHNVAKDCREDPYAWACPMNKNHPDYNNPNPKLAHPDPFTGQQWHKDNAGVGDTERGKKPRSRERG